MRSFVRFIGALVRPLACSSLLLLVVGCDDAERTPRRPDVMPSAPTKIEVDIDADRREEPLPNIVIVLIDTLRADHTSLAGYVRDTTPGLRRVAEQGLSFSRHFANAPWTRPSVASILTGLLPPSHRSQWGQLKRAAFGEIDLLPEEFDTIPELLRPHGYSTHAFITNGTVAEEFGYGQGFDQFEMLGSLLEHDRKALELTKSTLRSASGPVFVWCHLMAPHNYKMPPAAERFSHAWETLIKREQPHGEMMIDGYGLLAREQVEAIYDGTIVFADSLVTDLMAAIQRSHPNTFVIITSDHGEEFDEHGGYGHARTLYNEILRVPLVLWGPRIPAGQTVDRLTSSVDILPTILDYLDLPPVAGEGRSLLESESDPERVVYAEKRGGRQAMRALMTPEGKLIESKPLLAFDYAEKPAMEGEGTFEFYADETGTDDQPEPILEGRLAMLRARFEKIAEKSSRRFREATGREEVRGGLTEKDSEMLRALGYMR